MGKREVWCLDHRKHQLEVGLGDDRRFRALQL
jgi:hypothetical protein